MFCRVKSNYVSHQIIKSTSLHKEFFSDLELKTILCSAVRSTVLCLLDGENLHTNNDIQDQGE